MTAASNSEPSSPDKSTATPNTSYPRISAIGKSDKPAKRDLLDRSVYVTAIAALIYNGKTEAPLTIGIYGPWGSGKSSFLAQIAERLPKGHRVANFNPWRLSGSGEVWAGLVQEIAPIIDRHLGPFQRVRFLWSTDSTRSIGKLQTRVTAASKKISNWLTLATAFLAASSLQAAHLPEYLSNDWLDQEFKTIVTWLDAHDLSKIKWHLVVGFAAASVVGAVVAYKLTKTLFRPFSTQFKANLSQFKESSQLKNATFKDFEDLRKIVGDLTTRRAKRHKPHLVLLIDDLDRCAPERVVGVLEALNSFIADLPIITILAVDTRFIFNAVAARHRFLFTAQDGPDARERYGRLFIEKIVQIPFQLPAVQSYERYITDLLTIDAPLDEKQNDRQNSSPSLKLAELLEGRKQYQKLLALPFALYLIFSVRALSRANTDSRSNLTIAARLMMGLGLTTDQQNWVASREYADQIGYAIFEEELKKLSPTTAPLIFFIRFLSVSERVKKEVLSAAIKIQESDRAILRSHMGDLHGNPRSIKRFVNTYLLAKGISVFSTTDQSPGIRLEDLAAWLVLLQNWPKQGSLLCGQTLVTAKTKEPLIEKAWARIISSEGTPPEMVAFINAHKDGLERLASSARALSIAQCFSFHTTEPNLNSFCPF